MTQQPLVGQSLLVIETLRSRSDTPNSIGLLWTSDQPVAEPLPNTHRRQTTMTPAGFEPAIPGSEGRQTHFLGRAATRIGSYDNTSSMLLSYVYLLYYVCIVFFSIILNAGLLATGQYSEGPATGHLDTGFSWFPCAQKQMLRWFPIFQVATTCFSCSSPDLNLLVTNFMFCLHVK